MASDANLIKGARDAASGGLKMAQAGGNALGAAAQGLINRVDLNTADVKKKTDEAKELRRLSDEKFADNQEAAILQGGALGEAEFDLTEKKVNGLKKKYDQCALGDTACQRKVMMQLAKESQGLTAMKDTRALNAEAMSTLRGDVSGMDKEIMGIFSNSQSGDYTIDEDPTGEKTYTFTMADGTTEVRKGNDVQKLFEMQQDAVGSQKTSDMAIAEIARGKNGEAFDAFKTGATFDNLLKDDNSLMSALNDDWGVGNFSASIDKKIQSEIGGLNGKIDFAIEMRDKGIDIPAGEGEDNWYDNVTDEDIALIKQRLMNPESEEEKAISRDVAKTYYVDAMEQQNKKGAQELEDANNAAKQKRANELADKAREQGYKKELANLKGGIASEQSILDAKLKSGITSEKESVVKKLSIPNVNWKEGDDLEMKNINADPNVAITIGENLDNKNFIGGFQGQQDDSYYYKGSNNKFYKYNSYGDFAESNKIDIDTSNVDERGYPIISEEDQEKINDFNANKSGSLSGGQQVNRDQIYNDEGVGSATEKVTQKSGNVEVDKIMNKRNAEKEKADQEAKDQEILSWINNPDNANDPNLEAVKKQYYLNRPS